MTSTLFIHWNLHYFKNMMAVMFELIANKKNMNECKIRNKRKNK